MEADDGDVVAEADSDGCPLKTDSGGVEAEGDEDNRLQSAESGGEASKGNGDGGPLPSDDSVEVVVVFYASDTKLLKVTAVYVLC